MSRVNEGCIVTPSTSAIVIDTVLSKSPSPVYKSLSSDNAHKATIFYNPVKLDIVGSPYTSTLSDTELLTKRKEKVAQIKLRWSVTVIQAKWRGYSQRKNKQKHHMFAWPEPLMEDLSSAAISPPLHADQQTNLIWLGEHRSLLVRALTWNLCAQPPPPPPSFEPLLPRNRFHIYAIGTEECERSIAQSAINPSKKNWESDLQLALGSSYFPIRSHTLQAIHLIVFAHSSIISLISDVTSAAIPMGIGNTMGNKGGVAVSLRVGKTRFVFMNAHLEAHQKAWVERDGQANRLHEEMAVALQRGEPSRIRTNAGPVEALAESTKSVVNQSLDEYADRVIFMGDFNYRVNGNRDIVDTMLRLNMHEALISNDQLKITQARGSALLAYKEAPLNFKPTYKFDIDSDIYDTSLKKRIPSWTDRVLYIPKGLECLAYNADFSMRTSDHRPVYASFSALLEFESGYVVVDDERTIEYSAPSQVCVVM